MSHLRTSVWFPSTNWDTDFPAHFNFSFGATTLRASVLYISVQVDKGLEPVLPLPKSVPISPPAVYSFLCTNKQPVVLCFQPYSPSVLLYTTFWWFHAVTTHLLASCLHPLFQTLCSCNTQNKRSLQVASEIPPVKLEKLEVKCSWWIINLYAI
jgi:hypothetical protein